MSKSIEAKILANACCFVACVALCSPSRSSAATEQPSPVPLLAGSLVPPTAVFAGEPAAIAVKIRNVSPGAIVLALDDVLRSSFVTAESADKIEFQGEAAERTSDRENLATCPGDVPTLLVQPGESFVQVIRVPIPRKLRGRATLDLVLRFRRLDESFRCGSPIQTDVAVSGMVTVQMREGEIPRRRK